MFALILEGHRARCGQRHRTSFYMRSAPLHNAPPDHGCEFPLFLERRSLGRLSGSRAERERYDHRDHENTVRWRELFLPRIKNREFRILRLKKNRFENQEGPGRLESFSTKVSWVFTPSFGFPFMNSEAMFRRR